VIKLAAILATMHPQFFCPTSQLPASAALPFAAQRVRKVEASRQTLSGARPDVLVRIGSDHVRELWLDNALQFGSAPFARSRHQHLILPGGTS
jgi:protocatechuate 4,5-dioxygenase, beta chain